MTPDDVSQLIGIGLFVAIAGMILALSDRPFLSARLKASAAAPAPKPAPVRPEADEQRTGAFHKDFDRLLDQYDHPRGEGALAGEAQARFRVMAAERLEPLFEDVIRTATQHGHKARFEFVVEDEQAKYRLEVERSDHPHGQPLPYLTLSQGAGNDLLLLYGGVFPGPADHNGADAEIGWREIGWNQVGEEILAFAAKAFHRFDR